MNGLRAAAERCHVTCLGSLLQYPVGLVVLSLLASCGGKTEDDSQAGFGNVPPVSIANLAEVTASVICGRLEACCGRWGFGFDDAQCESALAGNFEPVTELLEGGGATLDQTLARRCIAEIEAGFASCGLESSASCRRALVGTTGKGDPCTTDEQCEQPADGDGWCPGEAICSFLRRARLGESCSQTCLERLELRAGFWPAYTNRFCQFAVFPTTGTQCLRNDGLYCSRSTRKCERLLPEGSACITGQCETRLWCDDGTCRPRVPEGESCPSTASPAVEPPCEEGLTCDADDRCRVLPGSLVPIHPSAESVCAAN